jgi:hypothetical protein
VTSSEALGEVALDQTWMTCLPGTDCSQLGDPNLRVPVATHVAMRAAWNPMLQGTMYASVLTRDCARDEERRDPKAVLYARTVDGAGDRCGGIRLHSGGAPSLTGGTLLAAPVTLVAEASGDPGTALVELPEYAIALGGAQYEYSGSTDVAPAIACAGKVAGAQGDRNCIVAWVDSGTPDHHVLVSHFVSDGKTVDLGAAYLLRPEVLRVVDGDGKESEVKEPGVVTSASDLSAAYVNGRFVIALKGSDHGHEGTVQVVSTAIGQIDRWEEWTVFADDHTIDAPSLRFDPLDGQAELGLLWTSLD